MRIIIEVSREELSEFNCSEAKLGSWIWGLLDGKIEPLLPKDIQSLANQELSDHGVDVDVNVETKLVR